MGPRPVTHSFGRVHSALSTTYDQPNFKPNFSCRDPVSAVKHTYANEIVTIYFYLDKGMTRAGFKARFVFLQINERNTRRF